MQFNFIIGLGNVVLIDTLCYLYEIPYVALMLEIYRISYIMFLLISIID